MIARSRLPPLPPLVQPPQCTVPSTARPIKIRSTANLDAKLVRCDVPCHVAGWPESTRGFEPGPGTDVVATDMIYYDEAWGKRLKADHKGLSLAIMAMEPGHYYEQIRGHLRSRYDIPMTYHTRGSAVPLPFISWRDFNILKPAPPWSSRIPAVAFIARNCASLNRREDMVEMLMKHVRVDALGDCLNNRDWPEDQVPRDRKVRLLRQYMFVIAAENGNEPDYVTEKVYEGLCAGAVPIYLGAPNVDDLVPAGSVVKVPQDFDEADIERVANLVKRVIDPVTGPPEYARLTRFKNGLDDSFRTRSNFSRTHSWCRLCRYVYHTRRHKHPWSHEWQQCGTHGK